MTAHSPRTQAGTEVDRVSPLPLGPPERRERLRGRGPGDRRPHYRRPLSVEQMRDLAGTDRVGTNLLGLVQAAEKLGFSAKAVKGSYETLPQVPLPAIAHVRTPRGPRALRRPLPGPPGRGRRRRPGPRASAVAVPRRVRPRWTGYLLLVVPEHAAAGGAGRAGVPVAPVPGPAGRPHAGAGRGVRLRPADDRAGGRHRRTSSSTWSTRCWSGTRRGCSTPWASACCWSSSSAPSSACCGSTCWPTSAARWTWR